MPRTSERAKATERPSERAKATERALLNHSVLRCDRARLRAALNGARTVATMPTGRSVDGSGAPEVVLLRGDSHAAARWAMAASDGAMEDCWTWSHDVTTHEDEDKVRTEAKPGPSGLRPNTEGSQSMDSVISSLEATLDLCGGDDLREQTSGAVGIH